MLHYVSVLYLLSKACCALSASSWFLSGCTKIDIYKEKFKVISYIYFFNKKIIERYLHDDISFLFRLSLCLGQSVKLQMDLD